LSAGASPQTPLGELTALPTPQLDFRRPTSNGGERREGREGERRGPPALPLHPSYYILDKGLVSTTPKTYSRSLLSNCDLTAR